MPPSSRFAPSVSEDAPVTRFVPVAGSVAVSLWCSWSTPEV